MIIIGIDPGITGAFSVHAGMYGPTTVHDLPVMAKGKGQSKVKNQINAGAFAEHLKYVKDKYAAHTIKVYLERISAMPGQGVASMFSMGDTYGCIRGVISAMGMPIEIITPLQWKRAYKLGHDKEVIRAKAIELFPRMSGSLSRKKDHNRAEALLIGRYGMVKEGRLNEN